MRKNRNRAKERNRKVGQITSYSFFLGKFHSPASKVRVKKVVESLSIRLYAKKDEICAS